MVAVCAPEKVPVVGDVNVIEAWTVPDPEASANRPEPPVTVKEPIRMKTFGVAVEQIVSCTGLGSTVSWSPQTLRVA